MLVESLLNKEMQGYTLNEEIYYVKWKVMKFLVCSKIFDQKSLKREKERERGRFIFFLPTDSALFPLKNLCPCSEKDLASAAPYLPPQNCVCRVQYNVVCTHVFSLRFELLSLPSHSLMTTQSGSSQEFTENTFCVFANRIKSSSISNCLENRYQNYQIPCNNFNTANGWLPICILSQWCEEENVL